MKFKSNILGALQMQDLKMTDHENYRAWKCRTRENDGQKLLQNTAPENDGSGHFKACK